MTSKLVSYYVITTKTKDFGEKFVVRKHFLGPGRLLTDAEPSAVTDSLEEARKAIPDGLLRQEPAELDDPVIVEFWT